MGEDRGLAIEVQDRIGLSNKLVVLSDRGLVLNYINRLKRELEHAERIVAGDEKPS
jgi:hypothetical protein